MGYKKWTRRETIFSLYIVASALIIVPLTFLQIVPGIGWGICILAIVLILPRFSLVFPAIAIGEESGEKLGEEYRFMDSWHLTQFYKPLMFFSVIVVPIVISIPIMLIGWLPYTFLFSNALSTLAIVMVVSSLSVAYKFISSETGKSN